MPLWLSRSARQLPNQQDKNGVDQSTDSAALSGAAAVVDRQASPIEPSLLSDTHQTASTRSGVTETKQGWSVFSRGSVQSLDVNHKITGAAAPAARPINYELVPGLADLQQQLSRHARFASCLVRLGLPLQGILPPLTKVPQPAGLKKAIAIGVHGYFPAKLTRALLGEPTGTSMRFADGAGDAIEAWAASHNIQLEVDRVALEGEGKIDHRVEHLYAMLLKYREKLQSADIVLFAVHSQGGVVATHLAARLIADKIIHPGTRQYVGLLSMAGTCLGPMPGLNGSIMMKAVSKIENDSLTELFLLQNPNSTLSKQYQAAMVKCLECGVRFTLVASADDQLVPLYSALAMHIRHPGIVRAAFIDRENTDPGILVPLLRLVILRLNMGLDDFGVIRALSAPLAGSYTGRGHSRLYDAPKVYELAVEALLETNCARYGNKPVLLNAEGRFSATGPAAHFGLSTSLARCLWESHQDQRPAPICKELFELLPSWKPANSGLENLKLCLELLHQQAKL